MKYILLFSISFFTLVASDAFITPSELKKTLQKKDLIILDVAEPSIYAKSHITGATNVDVSVFTDKESLYSLRKSDEIIQTQLRKLGIDNNSRVIIYSHNTHKGFLNSSYMAFILLYSGLENISILDGGYMAWVFENELLTSKLIGEIKDNANFTIHPNKEIIASLDYINDNITSIPILDARSPLEYYGVKHTKHVVNSGHIAHAKSSFYMNKFLLDGTLRADSELNEIYVDGHELTKSSEVVIYSNNIFSASMEFYILYKHMGFKKAKIYEASLLEWGNSLALPMRKFKWE